ncbi:hypothetical protein [Microcoleus sp. CAWBG58]|uniref:hypothetical protein n=1 Tax=Microcoleus sp. CAWBG58 TaxID=2841651 RepID=UPI0025D734D2|nr:hypothetical protein [Microcoleus sp. CAWBG58]
MRKSAIDFTKKNGLKASSFEGEIKQNYSLLFTVSFLGLLGRGRYLPVNCQLSTVNCQLFKDNHNLGGCCARRDWVR